MRVAHLGVGLAFLVVFLLTGQYMHWFLDHLAGMGETQRMLYRSIHIYLLWTALLNLGLGLYYRTSDMVTARRLQAAGSLLILVAPALLSVAFFLEPGLEGLQRPWTRPAIYAGFIGMLLHGAAAAYSLPARSRLGPAP